MWWNKKKDNTVNVKSINESIDKIQATVNRMNGTWEQKAAMLEKQMVAISNHMKQVPNYKAFIDQAQNSIETLSNKVDQMDADLDYDGQHEVCKICGIIGHTAEMMKMTVANAYDLSLPVYYTNDELTADIDLWDDDQYYHTACLKKAGYREVENNVEGWVKGKKK